MKMNAIYFSFFCSTSALFAQDLFQVIATDLDTNRQEIEGGSNFIDFIDSAVNREGSFESFNDSNSRFVLNYAGIPDAIEFSYTSATEAILKIPITNFSKAFTGTDQDDLENQLDEFLRDEGSDVVRDFLKAVNRLSLVSSTDGNPSSSTAVMAEGAFFDGAFDTSDNSRAPRAQFALGADFRSISAGGFEGTSYGFNVPLPKGRINDQVGYRIQVPVRYREIEGAESYSVGTTVAFPFQIIAPRYDDQGTESLGSDLKRQNGFGWKVTPSIGGLVSVSPDFAALGLLYSGTISNAIDYHWNDFTLTFGSQISVIESYSDLEVDGYDIGEEISQQILKFGLKGDYRFLGSNYVSAFGIHTSFLQDAAVSSFWTVGLGYGYEFGATPGEGPRIECSLYADITDEDFNSLGLKMGGLFRF